MIAAQHSDTTLSSKILCKVIASCAIYNWFRIIGTEVQYSTETLQVDGSTISREESLDMALALELLYFAYLVEFLMTHIVQRAED